MGRQTFNGAEPCDMGFTFPVKTHENESIGIRDPHAARVRGSRVRGWNRPTRSANDR